MDLSNMMLSSKIDSIRVAQGQIWNGTPRRYKLRYFIDRNGKVTKRQVCVKASDWEYHPKEDIERAATPDLRKPLDSLMPDAPSSIAFTMLC